VRNFCFFTLRGFLPGAPGAGTPPAVSCGTEGKKERERERESVCVCVSVPCISYNLTYVGGWMDEWHDASMRGSAWGQGSGAGRMHVRTR
jgi:hypothetical protein